MSESDGIFLTSTKFYYIVEELVWMEDMTYMDAVIRVCDDLSIDIEDIHKLKLVSTILKDRLRKEAISNGNLKPEAELPL